VEGVIVRVLQRGVFRVQLANGHGLLGYVPRRDRERSAHAAPGDRVVLDVSPFDLSKGRVRVSEGKKT
jgi:translation initiation factor IF-1